MYERRERSEEEAGNLKAERARDFDAEVLAKNESPISAEELLGEIFPLIEEYFLGEVRYCGDKIVYRLPNGQKFRLCATSE